MKKYLYGTTALAAVGLAAGSVSAAEPLHYELGGYYQQIFGYTDNDGAASAGTDEAVVYQNAEVYFKMRGELDNGLKIGGRIELEGQTQGDQIDQAYLILAGGFGELRIGAINSGRYSS
ncbi:MAG: porin, partial [Proteobacteria bacterium]|nr:porin [Pseudomonadota bacterium]